MNTTKLLPMKIKLEVLLKDLDEQREKIWSLRFKDFEDLKAAIETYKACWDEAYALWTDIKEEFADPDDDMNKELETLESRVEYHEEELEYFIWNNDK